MFFRFAMLQNLAMSTAKVVKIKVSEETAKKMSLFVMILVVNTGAHKICVITGISVVRYTKFLNMFSSAALFLKFFGIFIVFIALCIFLEIICQSCDNLSPDATCSVTEVCSEETHVNIFFELLVMMSAI